MDANSLAVVMDFLAFAFPEVEFTGRLRETPADVVTLADVAAATPIVDSGVIQTPPHAAAESAVNETIDEPADDELAPEPIGPDECSYHAKATELGFTICPACGKAVTGKSTMP